MNNYTSISNIYISSDSSHHIVRNKPLYKQRYKFVGKFHEPGLAPVWDDSGWFHINTKGLPVYSKRYDKAFGFYCGVATVIKDKKWVHINEYGEKIHNKNFDWSGNFQENLCVVKSCEGYLHIKKNGDNLYDMIYDYVGDFKDGIAVIYKSNKSSHINKTGKLTHNNWFKQVGVYHKGYATAEDDEGWFHIDLEGNELYPTRYRFVEPFYNDYARVETFSGKFLQVDINGNIFNQLGDDSERFYKTSISGDLVGFWKTQIIYAAVSLNIFSNLPTSVEKLSHALGIPENNLIRLLRALEELKLLNRENTIFSLSEKGDIFKKYPYLQDAAIMWGRVASQHWEKLPELLTQKEIDSHLSFKDTEPNQILGKCYQDALDGYLKDDLASLTNIVGNTNKNIICIGKSSELLIKSLKKTAPNTRFFSDLNNAKNSALCVFLKHLLHFDDKNVSKLLLKVKNLNIKNIIIIEPLISHESSAGGMLDINMLIESGGKLRTEKDYKALLDSKNYLIQSVKDITPYLQVIFAIQNNE